MSRRSSRRKAPQTAPSLTDAQREGMLSLIRGNEATVGAMLGLDDAASLHGSGNDDKAAALLQALSDVMTINCVGAEGLLAQWFPTSLLSEYSSKTLCKSGKGNAATLAARIVTTWARAGGPPPLPATSASSEPTPKRFKTIAKEMAAVASIASPSTTVASSATYGGRDSDAPSNIGVKTSTDRRYADGAGALQVGGHDDGMRFDGALVFKRMPRDDRGSRELCAMRMLCAHPSLSCWVPALHEPCPAVPGDESDSSGWFAMDNMVAGMQRPVGLDLKMGVRTWDSFSTAEQRRKKDEKARRRTSASLGVALVGGKIACDELGIECERVGYKSKKPAKDFAALRLVLRRFLRTEALCIAAREFVADLLAWFETQRELCFYSTSIFMAYDASRGHEARLVVKMIDFAHVERPSPPTLDEGYIKGLRTLCDALA